MANNSTIRLISTTLCGARDVDKVADALRYSGHLVNAHILIWTGDGDPPPELIAATYATVAETHIRSWRWTGSFADARNASLDFAAELGADWSVMIDADERIVCLDTIAARAWLASQPPEVHIVCAHTVDGTYTRERFFRREMKSRWYLRTHECIDTPTGIKRAWIPREICSWSELLKEPEDVEAKCERDLALIDLDLQDYPDGAANKRVLFYRGQTLEHMGRLQESIDCYRQVAQGNAGEGAAWAAFCAARNYLRIDPPDMRAALEACHATIQREPRLAEPYWLAGSIYHDLGMFDWAIAYEKMAQVHREGSESCYELGGFRVPAALTDGPQMVIDLCRARLAAMGEKRPGGAPAAPAPRVEKSDTSKVYIMVTGTGFRAHLDGAARKCIESVKRQTLGAAHVYIAADDDTLAMARDLKPDTIDGRGRSALENLLPVWRSLPPESVIVWLDGDDWLATPDALQRVAEAHARGAWMTYGQFVWSTSGAVGFAGPHDHSLPRTSSPWRATILRTFRAGLVQRIREEDLRWPDGRILDATLDQAIMLPCLEMAGPERAVFIPDVLAYYNDVNYLNMTDEAKAYEAEALSWIRSRPMYERLVSL